MIVVKADHSYIDFLSEFGSKSFIHAYQCTLPLKELRKYTNMVFSKSTIVKEIDDSLATYFVCLNAESTPCGYVKLIQSPAPKCIDSHSCIELQRLYVDSNYRGHGVGSYLKAHAELHTQRKNISTIWLRVWEGNVVSLNIYKKWKFTVVGHEQYQVGNDHRTVLVMHKTLLGSYTRDE